MVGSMRRLAQVMLVLFGALQVVLALRVVARMMRSAGGQRIASSTRPCAARVSVIVPVLNEQDRLDPCLAGLAAQGEVVSEILVVDGGSRDRTCDVVDRWAARDSRIRLIRAGSAAAGANGKVHNLQAGLRAASPEASWILTIDADVRPTAALASSLVGFAEDHGLQALSVATRQRLSGWEEALVHPAMLTTLVFRFGIPGHATADPHEIQANGQCMLLSRTALASVDGFADLGGVIAEDVTLARNLAARGIPVGFFESDDLVDVEMYDSARDALTNWSRSLPMRDRYWGPRERIGLAELALVQAAPLPLSLLARRPGLLGLLGRLNLGLVMMRLGTLAGTRRAYTEAPLTYWVSPITDIPVVAAVGLQAMRRTHTWRGRTVMRRDD